MTSQMDQSMTFGKRCAVCGTEGRVDINLHHPVYVPNTMMHIGKAFLRKGWTVYSDGNTFMVVCPTCADAKLKDGMGASE